MRTGEITHYTKIHGQNAEVKLNVPSEQDFSTNMLNLQAYRVPVKGLVSIVQPGLEGVLVDHEHHHGDEEVHEEHHDYH